MKTNCFCVFCSKHPLYNQREHAHTGFRDGRGISEKHLNDGARVECLEPEAFKECQRLLDGDESEYEYPITAYGDGISVAVGKMIYSSNIEAYCKNEDYKGE